ncbi:MAG: hypothetical protein OIF32_08395 [Campylobacterales bacterium]|nr:hypothetical protein [Campylobacterales bacterium]
MAGVDLVIILLRYLADTYPTHRSHFYKNRKLLDKALSDVNSNTLDSDLIDLVNSIDKDFYPTELTTKSVKVNIYSFLVNRKDIYTHY